MMGRREGEVSEPQGAPAWAARRPAPRLYGGQGGLVWQYLSIATLNSKMRIEYA